MNALRRMSAAKQGPKQEPKRENMNIGHQQT